jgi:hypothetical protein
MGVRQRRCSAHRIPFFRAPLECGLATHAGSGAGASPSERCTSSYDGRWRMRWRSQQQGLLRYNCADSLDRTNAASYFGAVQVGVQDCGGGSGPIARVPARACDAPFDDSAVGTLLSKQALTKAVRSRASGAWIAAARQAVDAGDANARHVWSRLQVLVEQCRRLGLVVEDGGRERRAAAERSAARRQRDAASGGGVDIGSIHARVKDMMRARSAVSEPQLATDTGLPEVRHALPAGITGANRMCPVWNEE